MRSQVTARKKRSPGLGPRTSLLPAGILGITFLAFVNALHGGFVYDDRFQVVRNPTIHSLANLPRVFTQSVWQFMSAGSTEAIGLYYRPIFNSALILIYQAFGFRVVGWHLISLALHVAATFLIFRLGIRWDLSPSVAGAAALFFGLHPIHSESVAWIAALPDPLALVNLLGALLIYERVYHRPGGKRWMLVFSLALTLMAMLSKEVALIFPVWLLMREAMDRRAHHSLRAGAIAAIRRTAGFFAVAAVCLAIRYHVLGFLSRVESHAIAIPQSDVFLTIPWVLVHYARLLVAPHPLAIVYDVEYVTSPADPRFWASVLVVLVLGAAFGVWIRGSAVAVRSALWTVLFILPVLNLKTFNQDESLIHDRYLYLPSVGFCLLLAVMLDRVSNRAGARRRWVFAGATLLIAIVYFGLTSTQNRSWKDDLAMTGQAIAVSPRNAFPHNYRGAWYFEHGQMLEAQDAYERALRIRPDYYDAYSNLADVYHVRGQFSEAERLYVRAIGLGARYPNAYFNLGVVLINQNKLIEAEGPLIEAVRIQPDFDKAHYNLGWVYARLGKDRLAEHEYRRTLEVRPSYVEARLNLSALLRKDGRIDAALRELEIARRFAPDHPAVRRALESQTNVP